MDTPHSRHLWLRGGLRADRQQALASLGLVPDHVMIVDAHHRLRGPYTAAGTLARSIVPAVMGRQPGLIARHEIELLSVAPELGAIIPNSHETLTSMAIPAERTRFYARLRTRRISNGLVEFIRDSRPASQPLVIVVENGEHAEHTDVEFLAALIRRSDPSAVRIIVCTGTDTVPDDELTDMLATYADVRLVSAGEGGGDGGLPIDTPAVGPAAGADGQRAWAYVATDGTSDDPELRASYEQIEPSARAELHDRRAADLAALDEQSLRLGAIPYHLERGADPSGAGAQALYAAQDYCLCIGFYDAVVDYGYRGLGLIEGGQETLWWMFTIELTLALSILSRTKEAEGLYDQARLRSTKPTVHMAAAYSTAMLYTRHNEVEDRDEHKAKAWLNAAIATASLIEDRSERAFQSAFYRNGLALVEVNLGEPSEALRLVNDCIDSLDRDLRPDEHRLHRSVLKNNRARVYASLGRFNEALADYAVVIGEDPNHAEHYLERGNILRRLGRIDEAFADYETACRLSPPFPEIYYNRADLQATVGDSDGALADFRYVVELDPDFVDAYVNCAGLLLEAGDLDSAGRAASEGLLRDPENPHLHAIVGQIRTAAGEFADAQASFDRAIAADPAMVAAWSGRAMLAYEVGALDAAISDLDRAVSLDPTDPTLRYNRAYALQRASRWPEALADLDVAAGLAPDEPDIETARATCCEAILRAGGADPRLDGDGVGRTTEHVGAAR